MRNSMGLLALVFVILTALPAHAAETPAAETPHIIITPPAMQAPLKVDEAKVKKALAATATLNAAEKKKLVSALRKQLPKKTDAEKAAERQATIMRWHAQSADDKQERAARTNTKWQSLSAAEKEYQRGQMIEKLQAMPPADRAAVLQPFMPPPPAAPKN